MFLDKANKLRWELVGTLLGVLFFVIPFYSCYIKDYSGPGWGFRWFIQFIPFLVFWTAGIFDEKRSYPTLRILFLLLLAYSVYTGYLGTMYALEPHRAPPIYFTYTWNFNLTVKTFL
jgi:hypothetical protein